MSNKEYMQLQRNKNIEVKKKLRQYSNLDNYVDALNKRKKKWEAVRSELKDIKAGVLKDINIQESKCDLCEDVEALLEYIDKEITELVNNEIEVIEALKKLTPVQRKVIEHRYLEDDRYKSDWKNIMKTLQYEESQIHKIHGKALFKLSEYWERGRNEKNNI